jgi:hypothetical protein
MATKRSEQQQEGDSLTFEYTVTGLERATPRQLAAVKSKILKLITEKLESPELQRKGVQAEFSRQHHDKGSIKL